MEENINHQPEPGEQEPTGQPEPTPQPEPPAPDQNTEPPTPPPPATPAAPKRYGTIHGFRLPAEIEKQYNQLRADAASRLGLKEPLNHTDAVTLCIAYCINDPYGDFPTPALTRFYSELQKIKENGRG